MTVFSRQVLGLGRSHPRRFELRTDTRPTPAEIREQQRAMGYDPANDGGPHDVKQWTNEVLCVTEWEGGVYSA